MDANYTLVSNVGDLPVIQPPPGAPTATATEYINVRTDPGFNYPVLFAAPPGATGEVSGNSADGRWWQVKISAPYGPNGLAWVSAGHVYTSNTDGVPVVDAPAPPDIPGTPPGLLPCVLVSQAPLDGASRFLAWLGKRRRSFVDKPSGLS